MVSNLRLNSILNYIMRLSVPIFLLLAISYLGSFEGLFNQHHELSWVIVLDLLLITPFAYFLAIRKSNIQNATTLPVFIACLALGYVVLPESSMVYLEAVKNWVLPFIEIVVVLFVFYKIFKVYRSFKKYKNTGFDFLTTLKTVLNNYFPSGVSSIIASEISMIYYGFFNWKKPQYMELEFTYHKTTGSISAMGAFLFLIGIETWIVHILLLKINFILAWILTILSIYSAFQLFGLLRSIPKRPHEIRDDKLYLRYGIFAETVIDLDNIKSIKTDYISSHIDNRILSLSPLSSMEGSNILIELKKEGTLSGIFGIQKSFRSLLFYVDDKAKMQEYLKDYS